MPQHDEPVIPWTFGELIVRALAPGPGAPGGTTLKPGSAAPAVPPGRWSVSSRTEVPYVQVQCGAFGSRVASWGDVVEIPERFQGTLSNASAHAGDVALEAIGTGQGYASKGPPGSLAVPTTFTQVGAAGTPWQTGVVDTRLARRAYLVLALNPPALVSLPYRVTYRPADSGGGLPWTGAAGSFDWLVTAQRYVSVLALGVGEGENREPAPGNNTIATPRPHALSDQLRVTIADADFVAAGLTTATPVLYLLEY